MTKGVKGRAKMLKGYIELEDGRRFGTVYSIKKDQILIEIEGEENFAKISIESMGHDDEKGEDLSIDVSIRNKETDAPVDGRIFILDKLK